MKPIDILFGETKSFYQEQNQPSDGYLGVGLNSDGRELVEWHKCREQFHRKMTEVQKSEFYFAHAPNKETSIACFMAKIEQIISLNFPIPRSVFSRTNKSFALWTSPSEFWKECNVKFNLYTILMRAGANYDYEKDNFDEALYSMPLVDGKILMQEGMWSVNRFLYGFTQFVPADENEKRKDVGWINIFKNKSKEQIRKQLVSPVEKQLYSIGGTALWT